MNNVQFILIRQRMRQKLTVFTIELQSLKASEHSLLQMQYQAALFTELDNHKNLTTETKIRLRFIYTSDLSSPNLWPCGFFDFKFLR
jgi:hypothetical protein